jgi:hypothetical protein
VNEEDFSEEFRHIIRRLKQAAESKEVAEQMIAEDELISDFQNLERQIAIRDEMLEEKDKKLEENNKKLVEKEDALEKERNENEKLKKQIAEMQKS